MCAENFVYEEVPLDCVEGLDYVVYLELALRFLLELLKSEFICQWLAPWVFCWCLEYCKIFDSFQLLGMLLVSE